jgi:ribosome modulation factor
MQAVEYPRTDLLSDVGKAFQEGTTAGLDLRSQASECPYPHHRLADRFQWMDGFAKGRKQAQQSMNPER